MFICQNIEGVHAHLSECERGTWSEKGWEPLCYCMTRPQTNTHCNVRELSHEVKCDCSVERIRKNINNLTASKRATIRY